MTRFTILTRGCVAAIATVIIAAWLLLLAVLLRALLLIGTVAAIIAFIAAVFGHTLFAVTGFGLIAVFGLPIALLAIITAIFLARTIFFIARTAIGDDAEVMIGELQIIFRHHTVTLLLGIARECVIFFEQLRCIAARAVINAIALFGTATPVVAGRTLVTPAATATGLTII